MLTIAFVNLKPGVGKSTSSVFTAQSLYEEGHNPLLVDADKGQSAVRWDELAGGMPFPVVAKATKTLHTSLPEIMAGRGSLVVDVPQVEDHAAIAKSALRYCNTWVLPIAPSMIEVDRMFADDILQDFLDETQDMRSEPADVVVLLTRTNTSRATKAGPDANVRAVMADKGFEVLTTQIKHNDDQFRQSGGSRIRAIGTPYQRLVRELLSRKAAG
ncbi:AAA family ATPase [Kitasatospora sp. NPDC058478]|uniref:AAA family ATPase n=1 Tax=unclassified Kitasatospora TaxID=2633591 RepID=UPI003654652F